MNKKAIVISTVCLLVALCVAIVGLTFAWYTSKTGTDTSMTLEANGVLVVYFDEDITKTDTALKPAVAKKGAITENVIAFNVLDETDPNVEKAATVAEFTSSFNYLNEESNVPADGGEGTQPKESSMTLKYTASMVFADGIEKALTERDLIVSASVSGSYIGVENGNFEVSGVEWNVPFTVSGNAGINIKVKAYLAQPDDLCTPYLLNAQKIKITVTVTAEPVTA